MSARALALPERRAPTVPSPRRSPAVVRVWGGDAGALQTLGRMVSVVNQSLADPLVRETAKDIVEFAPVRDQDAHARMIREWLFDRIRFMPDPRGVEIITTPRAMLETIQRKFYLTDDCDSAAVLAAALGKAIGLRARMNIVAFLTPDAPYQHVFTELGTARGWYGMDVTRPAGRARLPFSRRHIREV